MSTWSVVGNSLLTIVTSGIVATGISTYLNHRSAVDLKQLEVRLQQRSANLNRKGLAYTQLDAKVNDFELELDRYVVILKAGKANPRDVLLSREARSAWKAVTDRMAEMYRAARAADVDAKLRVMLDQIADRVAVHLQKMQQRPERDIGIVDDFDKSTKSELQSCRDTIRRLVEGLSEP